jgi:hypothetical protein
MSCFPVLELTVEEFVLLTATQLHRLSRDKLIIIRRADLDDTVPGSRHALVRDEGWEAEAAGLSRSAYEGPAVDDRLWQYGG